MAVPTITNIAPAKGITSGHTLVLIAGTNFRLPPAPDPRMPGGDVVPQTVAVMFGATPALRVDVLTQSLLGVLSPASDPGTVTISVQNLDDSGMPIVGELVSRLSAYTFARPRLDFEASSDLTRLVAQIVLEFRRQVIQNVVITTHTDFDPMTGDASDYIEIAKLPAIVLIGPDLEDNRFYTPNELSIDDADLAFVKIRREPRCVDVNFAVSGVTDNETVLLNLMAAFVNMFHLTKFISIPRTADSDELVSFELDVASGGQPKNTTVPNNSNLHAFRAAFLVRGFMMEDLSDFPDELVERIEGAVVDKNLEPTDQIGISLTSDKGP